MISYENEVDTANKLNNCFKITGIENNMFTPQKTLKKARIKLCNTLALPALSDVNENLTIKARDERRIIAAGWNLRGKERNTLGQIAKQILRLQRIKYNPNLVHYTEPQKKLDATCKHNGS